MSIVSHMVKAAEIAEDGIGAALEYRAVITMNARVLGAIRYRVRAAGGDPILDRAIAEQHVGIEPTLDRERYLAALLLDAAELAAIEKHLLAFRTEAVEQGFTSHRIRHGFSRYAVDAAVESVQIARAEITEDEQA